MKKLLFIASVLALLGVSSPSYATLLASGSTVVPDISPEAASSALIATTTSTFNTNNPGAGTGIKGSVTENVYRVVAGTLDFVYQVTVDSNSIESVEHVTGGSFAGFTTNVSQFASAPGLATGTDPSITANRGGSPIPPGNTTGGVVSFNFGLLGGIFAVQPGDTSFALIIRTNARNYKPGTIGVIDASGVTLPGFAPSAVPEPTSLMLLAGLSLGAAGAGAVRRWRKGQPEAV